MLFANITANLIGFFAVKFLDRKVYFAESASIIQVVSQLDLYLFPILVIFSLLVIFSYEQPIRNYLKMHSRNMPVSESTILNSRRKLLNEPFFLMGLDLFGWIAAAVIYAVSLWHAQADWFLIQDSLFMNLVTGLITTTAAFFILEHVLQKKLSSYFFPNGGLYATPKTIHIRIQTRFLAILFACNLIPIIAIIYAVQRTVNRYHDPFVALGNIHSIVFTDAIIFMIVGIWLTAMVSRNLSRPFTEIVQVLRKISRGNFNDRVQVTTNDEIGYTGDVINEMTIGLKERDQMRRSLEIAMDVQRNLLPKKNPEIKGLDIAGKSIYCDETGGDYYDFIEFDELEPKRIGVVVGDVSGHGISSALLMASARAFLRQRAVISGTIGQIVSDVNRQIARDVADSGNFMTLFFMIINTTEKKLTWIRAGHDPALLYDPKIGNIIELKGTGLPLGVNENQEYQANEKLDLSPGQIIVLGTDGIWEARNAQGQMFGKESIRRILKAKVDCDANSIREAIVDALIQFLGDAKTEDDITLVIIKVAF